MRFLTKAALALPLAASLVATAPTSADARTKDIVKYGAIGLGAYALGSALSGGYGYYDGGYYGGYYGGYPTYYSGYYDYYPSYYQSYSYGPTYYSYPSYGYYGY